MPGKASRANGKKGGRPKGSKSQATLTKEQARDALRVIVLREMEGLVSAQLSNAKGLKYLVIRDKRTGKFLRVGEVRAKALKQGDGADEEVVEIWEKDPSVQAFTDLMNRALDKPAEQEQAVSLSGTVVFKWQGEA
jgi:hypothetical protein